MRQNEWNFGSIYFTFGLQTNPTQILLIHYTVKPT